MSAGKYSEKISPVGALQQWRPEAAPTGLVVSGKVAANQHPFSIVRLQE